MIKIFNKLTIIINHPKMSSQIDLLVEEINDIVLKNKDKWQSFKNNSPEYPEKYKYIIVFGYSGIYHLEYVDNIGMWVHHSTCFRCLPGLLKKNFICWKPCCMDYPPENEIKKFRQEFDEISNTEN